MPDYSNHEKAVRVSVVLATSECSGETLMIEFKSPVPLRKENVDDAVAEGITLIDAGQFFEINVGPDL